MRQIRPLDPTTDRARVEAFFTAAQDYVILERDEPPGPEVTDEFFTQTPPGVDPSASQRLGLFDGDHLQALVEMSFGFPEADSAYIGLLIALPAARGTGAGTALLRACEAIARQRGAREIFMAVLDANPKGRAFWEREGFRVRLADRPVTLGTKTQIAHRLGKTLPPPFGAGCVYKR